VPEGESKEKGQLPVYQSNRSLREPQTAEQVRNNKENRISLHREGRPGEVAAALAALAENDFITGAEIPVDGGMAMRMV
jgi:NAD(P)-dependent dehydrogenase (short-subunit alcohol dehydrogenase family)